jgi:hypothetical protein
MKFYYICFLLALTNDVTFGKPTELQYNHTSYYFNYTNCNNTPYYIETAINTTNCNSITNNMCLNFTDTVGVFNTCELIINKSSNSAIAIMLTFLITVLVFLTYKMCCQNFIDNLCICIKDNLYNCLCPTDNPQYQPNYSSL